MPKCEPSLVTHRSLLLRTRRYIGAFVFLLNVINKLAKPLGLNLFDERFSEVRCTLCLHFSKISDISSKCLSYNWLFSRESSYKMDDSFWKSYIRREKALFAVPISFWAKFSEISDLQFEAPLIIALRASGVSALSETSRCAIKHVGDDNKFLSSSAPLVPIFTFCL